MTDPEPGRMRSGMDEDFPCGEETYRILGACFEVHNEMGCGFLESVYQECLRLEFQAQGIPFAERPRVRLSYKGRQLEKVFEPDFICFDRVIVEIKAVAGLRDAHRAQLLNYLQAGQHEVGLWVNFGRHPKLEYERMLSRIRCASQPQQGLE